MAKKIASKKSDKIGTGASIERNLVKRYAERQLDNCSTQGERYAWTKLIKWLEGQPKRALKKGGTGRK